MDSLATVSAAANRYDQFDSGQLKPLPATKTPLAGSLTSTRCGRQLDPMECVYKLWVLTRTLEGEQLLPEY